MVKIYDVYSLEKVRVAGKEGAFREPKMEDEINEELLPPKIVLQHSQTFLVLTFLFGKVPHNEVSPLRNAYIKE